MSDKKDLKSQQTNVADFLGKVAAMPSIKKGGQRGRLMFAMDATASREPTWDHACEIQNQMFIESDALGGLEVQLCFYRGFAEFRVSSWLKSANDLLHCMSAVRCEGGHTQIERVLKHAIKETGKQPVNALVFIGDCVEESADTLCHLAGKLGLLGVPVFIFQEGFDPYASSVMQQMAKLSNGAYCAFDSSSAKQLRDLLSAVAVYAAGGNSALEAFNRRKGTTVLKLEHKS